MSAELLTVIPRLGTLTYRVMGVTIDIRAWFHLKGHVVMRRGLGDLMSYKHCLIADVVQFVPDSVQP